MEATAARPFSPWLAILTKPRTTIQQLVDKPGYEWAPFYLAWMAGFIASLNRATTRSWGDEMSLPTIFLVAAVIGPIGGAVSGFVGAALLRFTGKWLDGKATAGNIRAAMAWALVPHVTSLIPLGLQFAILRAELFTMTVTPTLDAAPQWQILVLVETSTLQVILASWSFVLFLQCLAQVQGFSAWKAFGNVCLACLCFIACALAAPLVFSAYRTLVSPF